jgi:hypothetical protein
VGNVVVMSEFKCPFCGSDTSIKDNDRFSSILCGCRILIYYYDNAVDCVITKVEYLNYKQKDRGEGRYGEKEKKDKTI